MKPSQPHQLLLERGRKKVLQMARRYAARWPSIRYDDLVSEGNLAVTTQVPRFDPAKDDDFDAFIFNRIHSAMYYLARRVFRDAMREGKRVDDLADDTKDVGSIEDIADVMDPGAPTVRQLVVSDLQRAAAGLFAGLCGGISAIAEDAVVSSLDRARQTQALRMAIDELGEPMRSFVRFHYFDELPLEEVGVRLGVSKRTAQRIQDRARDWLKAWFMAHPRSSSDKVRR